MKALLVVFLLMLMGCSGATQAQPEPTPTRHIITQSEMATRSAKVAAELDVLGRLHELEVRTRQLEDRLNALEWTEQDAISVVQWQMSEDPVHLMGGTSRFLPELGAAATRATATTLLRAGQWSADYEAASFRWRVEGVIPSEPPQSFIFHAYEKTGIVVGTPRN